MAVVILQARTGSSRLPGKAMKEILGKPMLWYTIETLKLSSVVDRIVLAVPDSPRDDVLVPLAAACGIDVFRGSENNVLERFYKAAQEFKDRYYFRATGDNPIMDYANPERTLQYLIRHGLDYAVERGMPLGTVVEGFTADALNRAYREGGSPEDLEHVTWYIKKSNKFNIAAFDAPEEFRRPDVRLTVDYPEDFQRISRIIQDLYQEKIPAFKEIIAFLNIN